MDSLGRYKLIKKIGAGGMAEIYLARAFGAQGIEKTLVLKRILPAFVRDAHFITMFVDEAQVASKLNHSNIVQIYSFEQIGRDYVLAMELIDGPDLTKLLVTCRRRGRLLPPEVAAYITAEVAKGLDYAHNRRDEHGEALDIVHRDVSPQNVLLSWDGAAKIADFGIARARRLGEEGSGVIKGKFAYMSPEQASGEEVDRRSDIYSLGVVLYEMLTGKPLFRGKPGSQILERVKTAVIEPPTTIEASVPAPLEAIVMKCLRKDPTERYQTAREMATDLARYLHGLDELVDATTLEAFLREVLPRAAEGKASVAPPEEGGGEGAEGVLPTMAFQKGRSPRQTREKLNVVAVSGRLTGVETLKSQIGERRASARVRELLRIVEEISFKADGVVARQNEDGFLLYLGLPLSSVDDPIRALRLSLDVIDAGEGLSYDLPAPLHLGLGINRGPARVVRAGDGRVQEYEPLGMLASLADRLAADAGPGEIRVGGGVYRLCRRDFNFEELPPLDISRDAGSSSRPTEPEGETSAKRALVFRLLGAKTRAERRREVGAEGSLLGRGFELEQLRDLYREAVAGNSTRYVWVVSDMGLGKTRLVNELLARTETGGRRVVRADCTLAMRDISYGAAADLVRDACGIGEDDRPEAARTKLQATLARLRGKSAGDDSRAVATFCFLLGIPVPEGTPVVDDGEDRKEQVRRSVFKLLEGLSRSQPLVVVIENVHFADTPSLELLRSLAEGPLERPVLTIALGRPDERLVPLLGGFQRVVLKQLREEDRVTLVLERLGETEEARELARQICARTGGNPFFINEVIESLIDRGVVRFEGEERRLRIDRRGPIQIPTTLEGVIAARIDELPSDERLLLRWASVAGITFTVGMLSELAGGDVREPLDRLVKRRILVRKEQKEGKGSTPPEGTAPGDEKEATTVSGTYAFRYPVMREVAYDGLVGADRLSMHRRMAAMLAAAAGERPGPQSARIAVHLERAGELEAAAERYLEAAAAARASYANRDALRTYARAISLLPSDSEKRFWAHEAREQILRGLSRRREQMAELDEMRRIAQALRDPALGALAYNRLARLYLDLGRLPLASKALAVALESARRASDRGSEVEALRLLSVLARYEGHNRRALECCEEALSLVGQDKDALKQRGTILLARGEVQRQMGRLKEAVQSYAEALVIYRRLGIKRLQALTLNAMGLAARAVGEYEDAVALLRRSLKLDEEINDRFRVGQKLCNLGLTYAEAGDMDRAMKHLRRSAEVNQRLGDRKGLEETLVSLAEVLLGAGAASEARTTLEQARKLAASGESREGAVRTALLKADLALTEGDGAAAAAAGREAAELAAASAMLAAEAQAWVRVARGEIAGDHLDEARAALGKAGALLEQMGQVDRADAVHLGVAEAWSALGEDGAAARSFARAHAEVEARRGRMKSPALRAKYDALGRVRAIEEGFRRHDDARRVS